MKHYPSIQREIVDEKIYAFDKKDGTLIRAEYSFKKKHRCFTKFGTKKQLIDESTPIYGESIGLIMKTSDDMAYICQKYRFEELTCFFEFFGENSFAGLHEDEHHQVMLFDISVDKKGFIEPKEFIKIFGDNLIKDTFTQNCLYYGNASRPFIESVQNRTLDDMTFEGVVCKGKHVSPGMPLMFKIKSKEWISKVKERYTDPEKLKELL